MTAVIEAFAASSLTTLIMYPYRDFCKYFNHQDPFQNLNSTFALSRYKGMLENFSQLALLSLPNAALLSTYTYYPSTTGAVIGGFLHGVIRNSVSVHVAQMQRISQMSKKRAKVGPPDALSYLVGFSVAGVLSALTNGVAVRNCYYGGGGHPYNRGHYMGNTFFSDWWSVYRTHAFMTFITAPLRNTFSSVVSVKLRSSNIGSLQRLLYGEIEMYREAAVIARRMFYDEGITYFLKGTILTTFKVSVPFGFCCALYGQLLRLG